MVSTVFCPVVHTATIVFSGVSCGYHSVYEAYLVITIEFRPVVHMVTTVLSQMIHLVTTLSGGSYGYHCVKSNDSFGYHSVRWFVWLPMC